jgi:hypothetical protein
MQIQRNSNMALSKVIVAAVLAVACLLSGAVANRDLTTVRSAPACNCFDLEV